MDERPTLSDDARHLGRGMDAWTVATAAKRAVSWRPIELPDAVYPHRLLRKSARTPKTELVSERRQAIQMKIGIVYVYPAFMGSRYEEYAMRFLKSYHDNPPGIEHDSIVALNGVKQTSELCCMFSGLMNCSFLEHDNSGYDIGAFQHAARKFPCDMMVFFGASTYFVNPGWLIRMATSFQRHGDTLYGAMGNRGVQNLGVWPHIRTTAFWMRPDLLNNYPQIVTRPEQRHPFEHGQNCLTSWVRGQGKIVWVVTWTNELTMANWDDDPNGFHRGNQMALLAGDHMCEPPYYARR